MRQDPDAERGNGSIPWQKGIVKERGVKGRASSRVGALYLPDADNGALLLSFGVE
jgi:hypothetical protein